MVNYFFFLIIFVICINLKISNCSTFWHVTDTHSDWLYKEGSKPESLLNN